MNSIKYVILIAGVALLVGCGDSVSTKEVETTTVKKEVKDEEGKKRIEQLTEEEYEKMMMEALPSTQTIENAFRTQKELMPKMITLLKEIRKCLGNADSKSDIKVCQERMEVKAKEISMVDDEAEVLQEFAWDEAEKTEILKDMDETIAEMEKALPCIKEAKTIMDMAVCMGEDIKH